jgi:hypothetical protein
LTIVRQKPHKGVDEKPLFEGTFVQNEDGTFTLFAKINADGEITNCVANMTKP